nr:hypothetical protein CFP56_20633 [Quercus suber]
MDPILSRHVRCPPEAEESAFGIELEHKCHFCGASGGTVVLCQPRVTECNVSSDLCISVSVSGHGSSMADHGAASPTMLDWPSNLLRKHGRKATLQDQEPTLTFPMVKMNKNVRVGTVALDIPQGNLLFFPKQSPEHLHVAGRRQRRFQRQHQGFLVRQRTADITCFGPLIELAAADVHCCVCSWKAMQASATYGGNFTFSRETPSTGDQATARLNADKDQNATIKDGSNSSEVLRSDHADMKDVFERLHQCNMRHAS